MQWIKASERLPEPTNGYAKQIATRWTFDEVTKGERNIQMRITTANELRDLTKYLLDLRKVEWLDESAPEQGDGWVRVEELEKIKLEQYQKGYSEGIEFSKHPF